MKYRAILLTLCILSKLSAADEIDLGTTTPIPDEYSTTELAIEEYILNQQRRLVLPDQYYIDEECREMKEQVQYLLSNPDDSFAPRDRLMELLNEATTVCQNQKNRTIDSDDWMQKVNIISQEIDGSVVCATCSYNYLTTREPIPDGFSTYILALIPSPGLVDDNEWIDEFKYRFERVGDSIGEVKAALWLGDRRWNSLDIDRSKYFCDLFLLDYNDGPYLVVTSKRPDLITTGDEVVFVKFNSISKDRILRVMNVLEKELRTELNDKKRSLIVEEIKQRMLSTTDAFKDELKNVVVSWLEK